MLVRCRTNCREYWKPCRRKSGCVCTRNTTECRAVENVPRSSLACSTEWSCWPTKLGTQIFTLESPYLYVSVEVHARYDVTIKLIFVITYTVSPRNSGCYERRLYECLTEIHTILTNQLIPWSRVLLEKLTGSQLVEKLPAFYGTRRIITAITYVRHLSLSSARSIQSMLLHPTS